MLNRLLIDLSWASSHMEGNTYSRLDTRRLHEGVLARYGLRPSQMQAWKDAQGL